MTLPPLRSSKKCWTLRLPSKCFFSSPVISTDLVNRRQLKARDRDGRDQSMGDSFNAQRQALSKGISAVRIPQRLYMTGVGHHLDEIDLVLVADHPENVQLWFPSNLPLPVRDERSANGLPRLAYRLRYAMAINALQDICRFRRFYQAVVTKSRSHISTTQKTHTRAHGQLDRIQRRVTQAAATYQACWSAIRHLAPDEEFGPWKNTLQELRREDIRGPGREANETSESRYV